MSREGGTTQIGDGIARVRFSADESFFTSDVAQIFKAAGVAGKVAVGEFEQRLHRGEIHRLVGHQHRHDAEPDLALESLVQTVQIGNHGSLSPSIFQHENDSENDMKHAETEEPSQHGIIDQETVDEAQS